MGDDFILSKGRKMIHAIFKSLFKSSKPKDADIRRWAEIEYKKDSAFAYNYMLNHGSMPDLKLTDRML